MPFNGSGLYQRVYNWVTDKNNSIQITASRMDTEDNGFATGLSLCLTKDGQQTPTANLPMGGYAHTGVAAATLATQYARVDQVQNSAFNWIAGGGSADAITATYSPAVTALTDGLILNFRATAANATTTPTFAPNGLTAHTITKNGGAALIPGDIVGSLAEYTLVYNLSNTRWELRNPFATANPFSDASALVKNSSDATKLAILSAASITTATTRTYTLPDANTTLAGTDNTATFTNKTYDTAGTGNTFKINGTSITAISGNTAKVASVTGSLTNGHIATFDASGNIQDGGTPPSQIMTALGVGSIIIATLSTGSISAGGTTAAANLTPSYLQPGTSGGALSSGDSISGTWQALVSMVSGSNKCSLFQRTV